MSSLPFSVYDFFGYLASGVVVLAGLTAAFVGYGPFQESPNLIVGLLIVIAAYILGQIVANIAGDLIERRLVRGRLGAPTDILVGNQASPRLAKALPGYYTPLPRGVQAQVEQRASDRVGEALFFHCHAIMKSDPVVHGRLETFITLYGFCRNMVMALMLVALCLTIGLVLGTAETGPEVSPGWWVAATALAAVGLFYRYLKFYRQYSLELFTSYAECKSA
jgi:hypothetical protein